MKEYDDLAKEILDKLEKENFDKYMELCYDLIVNEDLANLKDEAESETAIENLERLIKYFSDKDEFEKCQNVMKIKIELEFNKKD